MFRLPANLVVKEQYTIIDPNNVVALEAALPSGSRILVSLIFAERYEGFEEDCLKANSILQEQSGLYPWEEYQRFVTADPDGEPVAWVSYQSSPVWWTWILIAIGGAFLLPILGAGSSWLIDLFFPGFGEIITMILPLVVIGGLAFFLLPMLKPAEEK